MTFLLLLVTAVVAYGQSATGGINGIVTDATGGVVAGVTLTLINQATGTEITAVSNPRGFYTFLNIQPGSYTLKAEMSGFKTGRIPAFGVNVNQTITQDITLALGEVTETVEVKGEAPLLQASTSELGTVIQQQAVDRMPLNGRNFTQLLLLTPGVTPVQTEQGARGTGGSLSDSALPGSKFVRPAVNGQWNRSNMFLMDGVLNTAYLYSGYAILPSIDAIQEFKVQSHNDKGEYGGVFGGVVNLVTRTGGNQLHGSLAEFLRNEVFNARDPFTDIVLDERTGRFAGPAKFRQNQFGGTLGGPVYIPHLYDGRDKTFFFFDYDGWRYRLAQKALYRVPTPQELSGNFSAWEQIIYDPATTRPDPNNPDLLIRDPFPGNIVPANQISKLMVNYMHDFFDSPNISGLAFDNVLNNRSRESNANSFEIKVDHRIGSKTTLFGRYNQFFNTEVIPNTLKNTILQSRPRKQLALGWNQIFTPNLVLQTRGAYTSIPFHYGRSTLVGLDTLRQDGWTTLDRWGIPIAFIDGLGETGLDGIGNELDHQFQYSEDLNWVRGNHQFKFGGLLFYQRRKTGPNPFNEIDFGGEQTADPQNLGETGIGLASALLGLPNVWYAETERLAITWPTWAFYAQDEWKVTPRLTLHLSLRYEFFNPPTYLDVTAGTFDYRSGDYLIGGGKLPPPCSTAGAAPCIPGDGTLSSLPGGSHIRLADRPDIRVPHRRNFGPRLGLAWQFAPKTVLRAGASLVYDVFSGIAQDSNNIQGRWPNSNFLEKPLNLLGESLTTLEAVQSQQNLPLPDDSPWFEDIGLDPNKKVPYSVQYNLELQHQLTDSLLASLAYVGSINRRTDLGYRFNAASTPGPATADEVDLRRPFPYMPFSPIYDTDLGRGSYHALQFKLDRRFAGGLMFLSAYTWSKAIDNGASGWFGSENGPSGRSSVQNEYDFRSNRSVASYDVPHNLSVAGSWDLPFGK
jgi:hypothetical protein